MTAGMEEAMSVGKYRKKPVEIEALHFTDKTDMSEVCEFMGGEVALNIKMQGVIIPTLEGDMVATFGDYIIKGIKGEFYPCKPDIFGMTYNVVKGELKDYCPMCGVGQQYITNPMYMHICTECKEQYTQSDLITK